MHEQPSFHSSAKHCHSWLQTISAKVWTYLTSYSQSQWIIGFSVWQEKSKFKRHHFRDISWIIKNFKLSRPWKREIIPPPPHLQNLWRPQAPWRGCRDKPGPTQHLCVLTSSPGMRSRRSLPSLDLSAPGSSALPSSFSTGFMPGGRPTCTHQQTQCRPPSPLIPHHLPLLVLHWPHAWQQANLHPQCRPRLTPPSSPLALCTNCCCVYINTELTPSSTLSWHHLQHWVDTILTLSCHHLQHWVATIFNTELPPSSTLSCHHLQHWVATIFNTELTPSSTLSWHHLDIHYSYILTCSKTKQKGLSCMSNFKHTEFLSQLPHIQIAGRAIKFNERGAFKSQHRTKVRTQDWSHETGLISQHRTDVTTHD